MLHLSTCTYPLCGPEHADLNDVRRQIGYSTDPAAFRIMVNADTAMYECESCKVSCAIPLGISSPLSLRVCCWFSSVQSHPLVLWIPTMLHYVRKVLTSEQSVFWHLISKNTRVSRTTPKHLSPLQQNLESCRLHIPCFGKKLACNYLKSGPQPLRIGHLTLHIKTSFLPENISICTDNNPTKHDQQVPLCGKNHKP